MVIVCLVNSTFGLKLQDRRKEGLSKSLFSKERFKNHEHTRKRSEKTKAGFDVFLSTPMVVDHFVMPDREARNESLDK